MWRACVMWPATRKDETTKDGVKENIMRNRNRNDKTEEEGARRAPRQDDWSRAPAWLVDVRRFVYLIASGAAIAAVVLALAIDHYRPKGGRVPPP